MTTQHQDTDPLRKWLTRGSLAAGIAYTATAEYELAIALGAVPLVAVMLPVAVDAYVVAALRWFRAFDIALSLGVMATAQIAAHLLDSGVMTVNAEMVAVVSLLVPVCLWRTHALARGGEKPQKPAKEPAAEKAAPAAPRRPRPPVVPAGARALPIVAKPTAVPDHVPPAWLDTPADATVLPIVAKPAPKTERLPAARSTAVAKAAPRPRTVTSKVAAPAPAADDELLAAARRDFTDGTPGVKALKERYGIGQARAQRIRDELRDETTIRVARDYQEATSE